MPLQLNTTLPSLCTFHGAMTSRFATPRAYPPLRKTNHLPAAVVKSRKTLQASCCQIAAVLRDSFVKAHPKISLNCSGPLNPYKFGFSKAYSTEKKAHSTLSELLDPTPAQISSDPPLMLIDPTHAQISSGPLPLLVDPSHDDPLPQSVVSTCAQVASDCPPHAF